MSFKPIQPEEQVQKACQCGLAALSSEDTNIPGNILDAVQSFKAIINGVVSGQLFICQKEKEAPPEKGAEPPKKPVKKKVSKKK